MKNALVETIEAYRGKSVPLAEKMGEPFFGAFVVWGSTLRFCCRWLFNVGDMGDWSDDLTVEERARQLPMRSV